MSFFFSNLNLNYFAGANSDSCEVTVVNFARKCTKPFLILWALKPKYILDFTSLSFIFPSSLKITTVLVTKWFLALLWVSVKSQYATLTFMVGTWQNVKSWKVQWASFLRATDSRVYHKGADILSLRAKHLVPKTNAQVESFLSVCKIMD